MSDRKPQILAQLAVDRDCLDKCHVCLKVASANLVRGKGQVVPLKQPETPEELEALLEARRLCPSEAIQIKTAETNLTEQNS